MPIHFAVFMTRQAISPRLAIRIFLNIDRSVLVLKCADVGYVTRLLAASAREVNRDARRRRD
jgi:hypothetical protein